MNRLTRGFFQRDALTVTQQLLGKLLVHETGEGTTAGRIVETEAYVGPKDQAAHTFNNRRSPRTEVQYGPAGHAYVYLIYGMYHCFNIVAADVNVPEVILIRALEPVDGLALMARRRRLSFVEGQSAVKLANGPGKLCAWPWPLTAGLMAPTCAMARCMWRMTGGHHSRRTLAFPRGLTSVMPGRLHITRGDGS